MQVWKSVAESILNPETQPYTTNILQKSRGLYQEYGNHQKWPTYTSSTECQNNRKIPRMEDLTDVAVRIAQNKLFKKDLNKIKTCLTAGKSICTNSSTRRGSKYSWENHFGKDKDFLTE